PDFTHCYLKFTAPCAPPPAISPTSDGLAVSTGATSPAERRCRVKNPPFKTLGSALTRFLGEYLPHQRAYSSNTIQSYRDCFKLLLRFVVGKGRRVSVLSLADLNPATITAFLDHLQTKRSKVAATRNIRLSA